MLLLVMTNSNISDEPKVIKIVISIAELFAKKDNMDFIH